MTPSDPESLAQAVLTPCADAAETARIAAVTRRWLERAVIGLNLCPFARAVHSKRQIRYAVTAVTSSDALLAELRHELELLVQADPEIIETTLLIHPRALIDFVEYNDFLPQADTVVRHLGLEGVVQIASFHPRYEFAGQRRRQHRELHESFAVSAAAFAARSERRPRRCRLSGCRGHLREKHRDHAPAGTRGLAAPLGDR